MFNTGDARVRFPIGLMSISHDLPKLYLKPISEKLDRYFPFHYEAWRCLLVDLLAALGDGPRWLPCGNQEPSAPKCFVQESLLRGGVLVTSGLMTYSIELTVRKVRSS